MWSAIGRVYAYWVSVSTVTFTTPYDRASRISSSAEPEPPWNTRSNGLSRPTLAPTARWFSSSGTAEPSHMCEPNSGSCPLATRSAEILTSGRTNPSSLSFGQWSVCSATCTGYLSATTWANSASATAPVTMFLTYWPDRNSAPPVDTWTMPSLPASANPRTAAFSVSDDVTLIAGYANPPAFARSSISAYTSGVAIGMAIDPPGSVLARISGSIPQPPGSAQSEETGCRADKPGAAPLSADSLPPWRGPPAGWSHEGSCARGYPVPRSGRGRRR